MRPFKIGVITDCFQLPVKEGLQKAKELGAEGIQIYAVAGEVCPESMDAHARKAFRAFCSDLGLEISALCGDLGGHGFSRESENANKVDRSNRIAELAADLGTSVVTTHIGVVPEDRSDPTYGVMRSACREMAQHAAGLGVTFAVETGPETATALKTFLEDVDAAGIGVNLDPANLVMVTADDPVQAVHTLKKYIVHTHAKDGVQHQRCNPLEVYNAFADLGIEGFDFGKYFDELPLGEGGVDWDGYLNALEEIGYRGYLTIERETGDNPIADIEKAVAFLRKKITT